MGSNYTYTADANSGGWTSTGTDVYTGTNLSNGSRIRAYEFTTPSDSSVKYYKASFSGSYTSLSGSGSIYIHLYSGSYNSNSVTVHRCYFDRYHYWAEMSGSGAIDSYSQYTSGGTVGTTFFKLSPGTKYTIYTCGAYDSSWAVYSNTATVDDMSAAAQRSRMWTVSSDWVSVSVDEYYANYTLSYSVNGKPITGSLPSDVTVSEKSPKLTLVDKLTYDKPSPIEYTLTPNRNGAGSVSGTGKSSLQSDFVQAYWTINGSDKSCGSSYTMTKSTTAYAKWEASNTYNNILNTITHTDGQGNVEYHKIKLYDQESLEETLTSNRKASFTFNSWWTTSDDTGQQVTKSSPVFAANSIIYAHWDKAWSSEDPETITLPSLDKTGYTIAGYSTSKSSSKVVYNVGDNIVPEVEGETKLYAVWTANTYEVTFDAQGGTVEPESKTVTYKQTYGTLPTPVLSAQEFSGWFTAPASESGNKVLSSTIVTTADNHTLYAKWNAKYGYTLKFNANGGAPVPPASLPSTQEKAEKSTTCNFYWNHVDMEKASAEWIGWSETPNGEVIQGGTQLGYYNADPGLALPYVMSNIELGTTVYKTLYAIYKSNGLVRVNDGSSWREAIPYVYTGTEWKQCVPYVYNGNQWEISS